MATPLALGSWLNRPHKVGSTSPGKWVHTNADSEVIVDLPGNTDTLGLQAELQRHAIAIQTRICQQVQLRIDAHGPECPQVCPDAGGGCAALDGFDLEDTSKQIVEYDERSDGGALAARFSCYTTPDNGPNGTYVAMSLTRATDGDVLAYTHNIAVTNKFCSIVQAETTRMIGKTPVLNSDGTGIELYNLKSDPKETTNLADQESETTGRLRDLALGWAKSTGVWKASAVFVRGIRDWFRGLLASMR